MSRPMDVRGDATPATAPRRVETAANQPLLCDDPQLLYVVESGEVDLFGVELDTDGRFGARHPLCQLLPGQAVLGLPPPPQGPGPGTGLLAVGMPGAVLGCWALDEALAAGLLPELEAAIARLCRELFPAGEVWPLAVASAAGPMTLAEGETLHPDPQGPALLWPRVQRGRLSWRDADEAAPVTATSATLPLCAGLMLRAAVATELDLLTSQDLRDAGGLAPAIERLQQLAAVALRERAEGAWRQRWERRGRAQDAGRRLASQALRDVVDVIEHGRAAGLSGVAAADPLTAVLHTVLRRQPPALPARRKEEVRDFPHGPEAGDDPGLPPEQRLDRLARAAGFMSRRIMLRGHWWQQTGDPFVGLLEVPGAEEDSREQVPVALLPQRHGYLMRSADGREQVVDEALALQLAPRGWVFYSRLPARQVGLGHIARAAGYHVRAEAGWMVGAGVMAGILALSVPLLTGYVVDAVIPRADYGRLLEAALVLLVVSLAIGAFEVVQSLAAVRLQGRIDRQLQSALFARLLDLPTSVFRRFPAGDLADRTLGLRKIIELLTANTLRSLLQVVFSSVSVLVLFMIDWRLALVAMLVVAAVLPLLLGASIVQRRMQADIARAQGRLDGLTVQLIAAVFKLRAAHAEERAFGRWLQLLLRQKVRKRQAFRWTNVVETMNAVVPVLAAAVLFTAAAWLIQDQLQAAAAALDPARAGGEPEELESPLSVGAFLAFYAAFGQFLTAILGAGLALTGLLEIGPHMERARPLLVAIAEQEGAPDVEGEDASQPALKASPGRLSGLVELRRITFRYQPGLPPALENLDMTIQPERITAIVGPSGSGKSTLVRLLLGFEFPERGGVFLDGKPLEGLDLSEVRRQIGVVMQAGRLSAGTIGENILAGGGDSLEEAWTAATQAGIAEDIKAMAMGMHTPLLDGGNTLSGGQRQRLMLARALVRRPRILILDEATSALDNRTQATVMRALEKLQNTRIVIAHRLSTIRRADDIIVLDQGQVVQQGSFDELMAKPGLFADMARRQLAVAS